MLTSDYLSNFTDELLSLYENLNKSILDDVVRRIVKEGRVTDSAEWQLIQLRNSNIIADETLKKVDALLPESEKKISRLFKRSAEISMKNDVIPLISTGKKVNLTLSPQMISVLESSILKTNGDIRNLTMTTGTMISDAYVNATTNAYMKVISGAFSYNEAIYQAIKDCALVGSQVSYKNGASMNIDSAIRMSVLTGVNQTVAKLTEIYSEDLGAEYYETTAHHGSRKSHSEWQGKVFKIKGSDPDYPNFYESTGYGTAQGLCGVNCRHSFFPYFIGLSKPAYTKEQLINYSERTYKYNGKELTDEECNRIQRRMERETREKKRVLSCYNTAINDCDDSELRELLLTKFAEESKLLKDKEKKMKLFIHKTNRSVDKSRTRVYGFNKSVSQKSVWASRK